MKDLLAAIKAALKKLEQYPERRKALEFEEASLLEKIPNLTDEVAAGNSKQVNALTIAKARLEVLPKDLGALRDEEQQAEYELASLVSRIGPAVSQMHVEECRRVKAEVQDFLKQRIGERSVYLADGMATQITSASKSCVKLENLRSFFGPMFGQITPDVVASRARYALEEISPLLQANHANAE